MRVDLWLWSLRTDETARHRTLLSPDERARAARFVKSIDADLYTAGRARLREILGAETGQSPPDLVFEYGPQGKPALAGGPAFNLSHAGGLAALAVSDDAAPGIDIEKMRPIERGVAQRFFSATENHVLAALPPDQWLAGFYRCWSRKEAVIKAVGQGLSMPLDSFDVTLERDGPARMTRIDGGDAINWQLAHFGPAKGFMGAVALRTDGAPMDLRWRERP